jgi:hypothetical protein
MRVGIMCFVVVARGLGDGRDRLSCSTSKGDAIRAGCE